MALPIATLASSLGVHASSIGVQVAAKMSLASESEVDVTRRYIHHADGNV